MTLQGIDPADPTPTTRRQFIFGAGSLGGVSDERPVLLYANRTTAGTETVNTIGTIILDQDDCDTRFGARSEARWAYAMYRAKDPLGKVYICAITEAAGGTAGTVVFSFGATNADVATAQQTVDCNWGGRSVSFVVNINDTTATQVTNAVNAITAADGGTWPFTVAAGAGAASYQLTATSANVGDRATFVLTPLTIVARGVTGNTISKAAVTNGTGSDDCTLAIAAATLSGPFYYQATSQAATGALTTTDSGVGETIAGINGWVAASVGFENELFVGLVGTQATGTTVTTSAGGNSAFVHFIRSKNSPWSPGMLAAYHCGLARSKQIVYPSDNFNGYTNTDSESYIVPAPYVKTDWPTAAEIVADLNNGICPISFDQSGRGTLVRFITSKSKNAAGVNDFRVREGHIPSAEFFAWQYMKSLWTATKQKNVAADPGTGQKPLPLFTYPKDVAALGRRVIDELTSAAPLGIYPSAILDPGSVDLMKKSIQATLTNVGGAGIAYRGEFRAVQHLIKSEFQLSETSTAQ